MDDFTPTVQNRPQKAVKQQVLTNFLLAHLVPKLPLATDLPDEEVTIAYFRKGWEIYFDNASRSIVMESTDDPQDYVTKIGIMFITLDNAIIPYSLLNQRMF